MTRTEKTITTIFFVPTLKIPRESLHDEGNGFLNAYIKDETRDMQYDDAVYLLFRPKNVDRFREFLDSEYERSKDIIEDYDLPNGFVVVVYKLNPKFKTDFNIIKESKYSKTSSEFQQVFPKTIPISVAGLRRDELSLQVRIFKKTPDLRKFWEEKLDVELGDDIEVWEGYHNENEILTEEKLKEYEER